MVTSVPTPGAACVASAAASFIATTFKEFWTVSDCFCSALLAAFAADAAGVLPGPCQ